MSRHVHSHAELLYFLVGSQDAGKTVMASDGEVNLLVEELGRTLNLKRHTSGSSEKKDVGTHLLSLTHFTLTRSLKTLNIHR